MAPKSKNPKTPKKATKPKVVRKLIDEDANYEDNEPLLWWRRNKSSPKAPPLPKPITVEDSNDTETTTPAESESSEHKGSKQTESEQPESEKAESKELEAENVESNKSDYEELSSETPSTENQDKKKPPVWGTLIKCKNPEVAATVDKRIRAALEPFATLPTRVVDLENYFDVRAQELTGVDLVEFRVALEKLKDNIVKDKKAEKDKRKRQEDNENERKAEKKAKKKKKEEKTK
ncbi:troponin T, cardiac muscle-like [Capsicum annuum]|uniref:troponin T, cardiac muscle-like n=1 Tax=Capsicum annuum TaxID=4072 RepID=UPI001FB050BB|nr:troponin T, cardiac muscle-like [Capsicum annuum]